jgi:hypothetical protein
MTTAKKVTTTTWSNRIVTHVARRGLHTNDDHFRTVFTRRITKSSTAMTTTHDQRRWKLSAIRRARTSELIITGCNN